VRKLILLLALALTLPALTSPALAAARGAEDEADLTRLLRYPDVHGDHIVFVYAGDLWLVGTAGGEARRLTTHPGYELSPKFSPDGQMIAFSGEYGGNRQVFVIPAAGGEPRQLTFHNDVGAMPPRGGFDHRVLGWTPDGQKVLFLANRTPWQERKSRPYVISAAGGMEEPLPIVESGTGSYSPDGTKFVFTPTQREFRTWKRYQGGQAQDVWVYDLTNETAVRMTDFAGTDHQPMWEGETIYFTSDRGGKLNLYALPAASAGVDASAGAGASAGVGASAEPRQLTHHDLFDVLWPSAGPGAIVYENGGWLYLFDIATETSRRVPIRVRGDFPHRLPHFLSVADNLESGAISPSGARAVVAARGEIFTLPAGPGEVRNLTRSQGIRERDPAWSPDGRWIAYLSDKSGEYELYVRPQDGTAPEDERQVTRGLAGWVFPPLWSPDSKYLAFGDTQQRLRVVNVATGALTEVDRSAYNDIGQYSWSPDSRWLAYVKSGANQLPSVWVHSLAAAESWQLTSDWTADTDPVFDPEGRYLYFLSNRDYSITFSGYEFNYVYTDPVRVYAGLLNADSPALFPPKETEEEVAVEAAGGKDGNPKNGADKNGAGKNGNGKADEAFRLTVVGFNERVRALPGPAGNHRNLQASADAVFYLVGNGRETRLERVRLDGEEPEVILTGVNNYEISRDGKKVAFSRGPGLGITDVRPGASASDGLLPLDRLEVKVDPVAEWKQEVVDAWRIIRDWFYDPNMHGLDWEEIRDRYIPLVEHVAHRQDLDYILGEIAAELEAGHAYVQPAPGSSDVERREGGLLGAEIEADPSGAFRIARIFPGENWHADFRSPLTEPGVDVSPGDFILAVDGRSTRTVANFYELLEGKAGQEVRLAVNGTPSAEGAREITVRPISSEINLRYLDWVESRRRRASEASGGRIGYIHLPDTAFDGNRELAKAFLPQANKDALIFDARYNGGGLVPDRMIELASRELLHYWKARGVELTPVPGFVHNGPKVALMNGYSGSGGDAFPYYFRKLGLGPLIGTATWGGLIGVSGNPSLADGGQVSVPTFRFLTTDGFWAVEGIGVKPDIEVVDRPDALARGEDPSLDRAIEALLEELEKNPPQKVEAPPPPRH